MRLGLQYCSAAVLLVALTTGCSSNTKDEKLSLERLEYYLFSEMPASATLLVIEPDDTVRVNYLAGIRRKGARNRVKFQHIGVWTAVLKQINRYETELPRPVASANRECDGPVIEDAGFASLDVQLEDFYEQYLFSANCGPPIDEVGQELRLLANELLRSTRSR